MSTLLCRRTTIITEVKTRLVVDISRNILCGLTTLGMQREAEKHNLEMPLNCGFWLISRLK